MMAIYDGLLEYHPKTMEPIPAIAESREINKDGTEYIFHLRKNAKFSNGDPITAKIFVYSPPFSLWFLLKSILIVSNYPMDV